VRIFNERSSSANRSPPRKTPAGTAPCTWLAGTETSLAFIDIHPLNEGHCLFIPKKHFATVFEIPPDIFAVVGWLTVRLAIAVRYSSLLD